MARPALGAGRLLEVYGDMHPRGIIAILVTEDRTRLTGRLTLYFSDVLLLMLCQINHQKRKRPLKAVLV